MKRGWRTAVLILSAILAIIAVCVALPGPRQPVYQGRKLSSWLADLRLGKPDARTNAVLAIRHMGTNAVPFLVRELHAKDSPLEIKCVDLLSRQHWVRFKYRFDFERRDDALRGLAALGPDAKAAIPEIAKLLNDWRQAQMAAYTLSRIGPDAVPALNAGLGSTNERVRSQAAGFLGLQKGDSENVVPNLIKALKDPDFIVKSKAARALTRFPEQADIIVPALISALDDSDETFRSNVARSLAAFGDKAKPATPKLLKMVEAGDSNESATAARVLLKLDRDGTIATFTKKLESPDVEVRRKTAWALMSWKSEATPAIPALVKCLKDTDKMVKQNAAVALREIAAEPDIVVPALMENLNDPDLKVRSITAIALSSFGEKAKSAAPTIINLIRENRNDELTAGGLYNALTRIDPEAAEKFSKE